MRVNPILKNEIKLNTRTMRIAWIVFFYNAVLAAAGMLGLHEMIEWLGYGYNRFSNMVQLYIIMAYIEFAMITVLIPALTAGSITGEKERQTMDILLTTKIKPSEIIYGKLVSSLNTVLLLAVSGIPVLSLVFVFGGITFADIAALVLIIAVLAVFVGSIGIFYSAMVKKTSTATVLTYLTITVIYAGTYFLLKAIYYIQSQKMLDAAEYFAPDLHGLLYILLINPIFSFFTLISNQAGSSQAIMNLYNTFGKYNGDFVVSNWVAFSVTLQFLISMLFLFIASRKIDPLK